MAIGLDKNIIVLLEHFIVKMAFQSIKISKVSRGKCPQNQLVAHMIPQWFKLDSLKMEQFLLVTVTHNRYKVKVLNSWK